MGGELLLTWPVLPYDVRQLIVPLDLHRHRPSHGHAWIMAFRRRGEPLNRSADARLRR